MTEARSHFLPEHLAARRAAARREGLTQVAAACIAVACFVGAGWLITPINRIRQERQLVIDADRLGTLPPDLALLGKLGTFRALVIDWASIRAERLKEEGKYYEALPLHETVCALAPRFPRVWSNAAWNMAYNISVCEYTPEARWKWVSSGISILRDQGLKYNPRAVALYKELSWIYWHKIGDFLDDQHHAYKRALAVEMERVLGPPPIVLDEQEYFDWFQRIVDAPRDVKALLESDEQAARLAFQLSEVRLGLDETLLEFVARHKRPELQIRRPQAQRPTDTPLTPRRLEILNDPERQETVERVLAAVRSRVLRERYKFDLDFMCKLMVEECGPLDWRNAFSHALYWASYGDMLAEGHENLSIHDQINNARFILMSLQNLVLKGRITLSPNFDSVFESYLELTPDTRFIPYLHDMYMKLGKKYFSDHPKYREGTPGPNFMTGFVTNMRNWIVLLYLEGGQKKLDLAKEYYTWLRENNPHPDGTTQGQYQQSLAQFVIGDMLSQLHTYKAAGTFIRSLAHRALKQFSLSLNTAAVSSLVRARQAYEYWQADIRNDINERRQLQPFRLMVRDEIQVFMTAPAIAPLYKTMLWRNLSGQSVELCQMVYDRLLPYFIRLCEAQDPSWDLSVAFAEPPGMAAFRQKEIEFRGAGRREGVEEGTRDR